MTNRPEFRQVWRLLCLPLEALRVLLLPVGLALYLLTLNLTFCLWLVLWFLVHFGILVLLNPDAASLFTDRLFFAGSVVLYVCNKYRDGFRRFIRRMRAAGWRLSPPPPPVKQIRASIAVQATADASQTRQRMTARLSPELQRMLVEDEARRRA